MVFWGFSERSKEAGRGVVRRNGCPKGCFWRVRFFSAPLRFAPKTPENFMDDRFFARRLLRPFGARKITQKSKFSRELQNRPDSHLPARDPQKTKTNIHKIAPPRPLRGAPKRNKPTQFAPPHGRNRSGGRTRGGWYESRWVWS